jgi:hypothetical protein
MAAILRASPPVVIAGLVPEEKFRQIGAKTHH